MKNEIDPMQRALYDWLSKRARASARDVRLSGVAHFTNVEQARAALEKLVSSDRAKRITSRNKSGRRVVYYEPVSENQRAWLLRNRWVFAYQRGR